MGLFIQYLFKNIKIKQYKEIFCFKSMASMSTRRSKQQEDIEESELSSHNSEDSLTIDSLSAHKVIGKMRNTIYPTVKPMVIYAYNASGLYLFWICLHYAAANMYTYYCVPSFFQGFIMSPFLVSAPHCKAIRWVVHNGGNTIDNMWIMLATWICSKLFMNVNINHKNNTEKED
jgi:hypothetical protein|tara:strand:- start:18385 stop:18906 length:522 start_codon:yes stop_codon:yes gene_type:complete